MPVTPLRLRHVVVVASLIAAAGCASSDSADSPPKSAASGPAGVESETDFAKRMDQMRRAMENLPGEGDATTAAATPGNPATNDWTPADSSDPRRTTANSLASGPRPVAIDDADPADNAKPNVTVATEPQWRPTPEQRRSQLVHELAAALRQEVGASEGDALGALMRLAALDAVEPGVFNSYFVADGRSPESALTERELAFLTRYRDMLESLRAETAGEGGSRGWGVEPLVQIVDDAAKDMSELSRITIREAKMCARVETIGRYTELDRYGETYKFLAGTGRHRAIVYVEPAGFGQRAQTHNGASGWQVEMEQDLLLYRLDEQADMLAWQLVGQGVTEFSRVRRSDFFLTTVIDLPPTLSVGKYRLKVLLRDRTSGAEAEKTLNIEVVANRAALREG